MPNRDLEHQVRDALRAQADLHPFTPVNGERTRRQAKRRVVRNSVGAAMLAGLVVLGALIGANSLLSAPAPQPATPTPVAGATGQLAFIRNDGVYVLGQSGDARRVTGLGEVAGWFPDGRSLLVVRGGERGTRLLRIRVADGSPMSIQIGAFSPTTVTLRGWELITHLAMSPDGTRLAIGGQSTHVSGGPGLFVTDLGGGQARRVFRGQAYEPSWSADGTKIAFNAGRRIHIVAANGGALETLPIPDPRDIAGGPTWSPDGTRIALSIEEHDSPTESHLFVVGADGSGLTRLADQNDFQPSWAPDGRSITFTREDGDPSLGHVTTRILSFDLATSTIRPIVPAPGNPLVPRWGPSPT